MSKNEGAKEKKIKELLQKIRNLNFMHEKEKTLW
jgi:hypothetical protein